MYEGLLGSPDMQVRGNGSSSTHLAWFTDRSGAVLPSAWMMSVPIMVYRGVMLAWALWAALALLKWIKWGWGSFTEGGGWKKPPPPPPRPARPPQGAPPGYGPPPGYGQPPAPPAAEGTTLGPAPVPSFDDDLTRKV
jgi:hypothetical protein